jgi:hypothetical protein
MRWLSVGLGFRTPCSWVRPEIKEKNPLYCPINLDPFSFRLRGKRRNTTWASAIP